MLKNRFFLHISYYMSHNILTYKYHTQQKTHLQKIYIFVWLLFHAKVKFNFDMK